MLLVADVGNTNTVFGAGAAASSAFDHTWRVSSSRERMADEWLALLSALLRPGGRVLGDIDAMIVSSVVPVITNALAELGARLGIETIIVNADLDLGIQLAVDAPHEVGADRIVNAAYAYEQYGGPIIVVDMGTATKIEAIDAGGAFRGGVIAPGIGLTLDALANRAARLYAVELKLRDRAIGSNTVAAVQSGVVTGHLAMIEGMVARVAAELGTPREIVLTGGYSRILAGSSTLFTRHEPEMLLAGLRHLYNRNRHV